MNHKSIQPIQLFTIGILLIGISIINLFLDIPGTIHEYLFEKRINETGIVTYPPLDKLKKDQRDTSDLDFQANKIELRQELYAIDRMLLNQESSPPLTIRNAYIPDRIVIDSIHLDAPVIIASNQSVEVKDQWFEQWNAPDEFAVGWHDHSAPLGVSGNVVLNGHHNEFGKVFANLVYLKKGDLIHLYSGSKSFWYEVSTMMVLKERDASIETRMENAQWINETEDDRLTLVTCWPKRNNTHRFIVVAYPVVNEKSPELSQVAP